MHQHNNYEPSNIKETNNRTILPDTDVHVCSLCEDNFSSQEDYDTHVNEHIQEINEIYIESLKGGSEIFKCNLCGFQAGQTVPVKDHLKEHIKTSLSTTNCDLDIASQKEKKQNAKIEALKSGNLLDLYDEDGNPLYETTEDESSDSE